MLDIIQEADIAHRKWKLYRQKYRTTKSGRYQKTERKLYLEWCDKEEQLGRYIDTILKQKQKGT